MKYLTFLDFRTVESVGKDFESKLEERDQEVSSLVENIKKLEHEKEDMSSKLHELEQSHIEHEKEIDERINKIMSIVQQNPKLAHVKPEALIKKN